MSSRSPVGIDYGHEPGEFLERVPILTASCRDGSGVIKVNGHGSASVRAALAQLTEECDCGANWHYDEDGGGE